MSEALVTRTRIQRLLDEREAVTTLHENMLKDAEIRADRELTDIEEATVNGYRTRAKEIDGEIKQLHEVLKQEEESALVSKQVRQHLTGAGIRTDGNGETVYRTFAQYARDKIIAKPVGQLTENIVREAGGEVAMQAARERLMRTPEHTLTSDVDGLLPPQHITQILDVINKSRPVVATANRQDLARGTLTYPKITGRPEVLLQPAEKQEGGTAKMEVEMGTLTAQTFIGGGNLSWQMINWSTPDGLALWFDLAGEAYAQQTEGTACAVLDAAAAAGGTAPVPVTGGTADTFQDWISAVVGGAGVVYANSGRVPDTLYLSPDMFFVAAALTSDSGASFISAGQLSVGGLSGSIAGIRVVTSPGFGTATAIIGDSRAFMVGETPGAPVELRAVEPAIGGLEVGVIGAFGAVVFDDARFATLT